MRIFLLIIVSLAVCSAANTNTTKTTKATKATSKPSSKSSKKEGREKRTLEFGNYLNSPRNSNLYQISSLPRINRRIATGYHHNEPYYSTNYAPSSTYNKVPTYSMEPIAQYSHNDPLYPGFVRDFDSQGSNFINDHHYAPQYIEAPEPIIEIIIRESNETLAAPPLPVPQPLKKPKEQVQVFYVKYKKDDHKGLVIDDPIPALSPTAYHQESKSEEQEEFHQDQPYIVTPVPPLKTTTLKTIIHPDSERYHSNSGIHVTFNSEDKSQTGHSYQEHIEESALQPVVFNERPPTEQFPSVPTFQALPQIYQNQQFQPKHSGQQSRSSHSFDGQHNNHQTPQQNQQYQFQQPLINTQQQLPLQNTPAKPFRENQNSDYQYYQQRDKEIQQFHRLQQQTQPPQQPQQQQQQQLQQPPHHHQPIRFIQNQQFEQRPHNNKPYQYQSDDSEFLRHQQPQKYRPQQPKPIPIPIHTVQPPQNHGTFNRIPQFGPPEQAPLPNPQFQQPFNNFQEYNKQSQYRLKSVVPAPTLPPPSPSPPQHQQAHQNQLFNSYQQQQQHQFGQQSSQQSNFDQQYTQHLQPAQQYLHQQQNLENIQGGGIVQQNAPNLANQQTEHDHVNSIVTGAELIQSVPKYEQHITETRPNGQILLPFSRPTNLNVTPLTTKYETYHQQPVSNQNINHIEQYNQHEQFVPQQKSVSPSKNITKIYPENQRYNLPTLSANSDQNDESYREQKYTSAKPLIIPNSVPIKQKLIPGQSVSTLAEEVFPTLENQQFRYFIRQKEADDESEQDIAGRNRYSIQQTVTVTQKPHYFSSTTEHSSSVYKSTTPSTTTAREKVTITAAPPTKKSKKPQFELPDEVPDELREQLLSSGILDNADISVLDYDKIGDVPLESLPPEHLANFYGAGGGTQISSSNKVITVVKPNGQKVELKYKTSDKPNEENKSKLDVENIEKISQSDKVALPKKQNVDLKVVRFDSNNQKSVTDHYIKNDSKVLPSVDITTGDQQYNRYLPLKVNGAQFPIPNVEELKGKKIASIVVLAPVDNYQPLDESAEGRYERDILESRQIKFVAGDSLKQLLKKPTKENFKRWLDKESKIDVDLQSVVLLVTQNEKDEKEIFMYDITTHKVNKLNGELSSAFVNVAEENANAQDIENVSLSDSGIVEQMNRTISATLTSVVTPSSISKIEQDIYDAISADEDDDSNDNDAQPQASRRIDTFVLPDSEPLPHTDYKYSNKIDISSGYSSINL